MPFVTLNETLIHYADEGPRGAPALALLNSLGTDFRIWDAVAALLSSRYRVIRADKRGHGLSGISSPAPAMGEYAGDTAALLDFCGVKRATIVGVSMGGQIALELHRARPDLVVGLVLSDTAAKIGNDETWGARIAAIEQGGIASIADTILLRWFSAEFRARRQDELAGYRNMLIHQPQAGYLAACRALQRADLRAHARQMRAPTLCLVGEEDGSTPPAVVKETADWIAGAGFEILPGAGHLPTIERPDVVAARIDGLAQRALA